MNYAQGSTLRHTMQALALAIPLALLAGCNAETEPATNIGTTSATLHAKLSASSGERVAWWFRYRDADAFNWTDTPHAGPATVGAISDYDYAVTVNGLLEGHTYEYELCGYREAANGYSAAGSAQNPVCADSTGFGHNPPVDDVVTTAPPAQQFPNPQSTGTPPGWTPSTTTSSTINVTTNGAVVQDVRLTNGAGIDVRAQNVTIRRVELDGGHVNNQPESTCGNGLLIEDTSFLGPDLEAGQEAAIRFGGYTARRVEIQDRHEGFRVSSQPACGPVTIEDSFAHIVAPSPCGDWHGDGIQGFDGSAVTVHNVTIDMRTTGCFGTAPFFYPKNQGNTGPATINRLLVMGQGYPFRLGTTGTVNVLRVVNNSWIFGPVDVDCSQVSQWDARKVTIDSNYAVTADNGAITCTGTGT